MRPNEGAGRSAATDRDPHTTDNEAIVPPLQRLGNCLNCGQHIKLTGAFTTCGQCAAWRRWHSAHRLASQALREVRR